MTIAPLRRSDRDEPRGKSDRHRKLFFCSGPPKSGTTFLQRLLNLHPEIACPPEHDFNFLFQELHRILTRYDRVLEQLDYRTGSQGVVPLTDTVLLPLIRFTIEEMLSVYANGKPVIGANDNNIFRKLDFYDTVFHHPKFIAIFRNPIDAAISAWHHNHKLAEEENDESHIQLMTRHGGFEEWIEFYARSMEADLKTVIQFSSAHQNILIIRYEDLVEKKAKTVHLLFKYLNVSVDPEIMDMIIEQSSLDAMKASSRRKSFFRSGSTNMGQGTLSKEFREKIAAMVPEYYHYLGYECPS